MRSAALFALVVLTACSTDQAGVTREPAQVKAPAPAPEAKRSDAYGDPLSAGAEKVALADLVKTPNKWADKTVHVEGKVVAVCQNKGCWLEIGDETGTAHVKLGGHKFFVPRTASGRQAAVEARVQPAVDKGHCEQEAEEQTGRVAKVELFATGVELF
jgi:hypothetical protein